ncbi:17.8 kDa class I heat shock protein [Abrus precatorius]|uniref:17.8 kDa class I heat shock protein n=1 Tax=Abrus precatorius TaxID=3816 RepID=A0A8B8MKT3_ABRPR|nr:17.8 kDa class I heat shock protein [Abrus precatorius]
MEVELGLKITRTRDDITSVSDFQFAKDKTGPVFLSTETDATFKLTAHLKGYKKENIDITISKDGTQISVSGEKEVQEMQMIQFKKELKIKGFAKKFKIPDGVVLDRIKAKYNEEDALLTIVMPKGEMGKGGFGIEEVKEEAESSIAEEKVVDNSVTPEPEQSLVEKVADKTEEETPPVKKRGPKKPWKPCPPLFLGGSTLLVSLIFLVIHYIRVRKS